MIAALYVERDGIYAGLDDVDVWDEERDARLYAGPWPVVAHPPCQRWSVMAGLVERVYGYRRGDDGGCFEAALDAVRRFGGVLEHPFASAAWDRFGLPEPQTDEGWTLGFCGGWSAYVEQGRYGLPVRKATWLYAYGVDELPPLRWGRTPPGSGEWEAGWRMRTRYKPDGGLHPRASRGAGRRLSSEAAQATPLAFRDVLLNMARGVERRAA